MDLRTMTAASLAAATGLALSAGVAPARAGSPARNVVLVHGLFADGSSWSDVIGPLHAQGLNVAAVQNPLTTLDPAADAVRRVLARSEGPTVLAGHSFAGTIISEVGDADNVSALLYIVARAPDAGEDYAAPPGG
jgi:pimeloyl-ACP methyl ester carboxylesterase